MILRSIRRNLRLITLILVCFCIGMGILVYKIYKESSFYMTHSSASILGKVYDRDNDVLFDQNATAETYGEDHFTDIANIIGDHTKHMTNTLVSENKQYGNRENDGESAIFTTLSHRANKAVYDSFGGKNGAAIAYNYITGEILICVSKPGLNPFTGYADVENLEEGSFLNKAFCAFTPGSTQKVPTLIAAHETMGTDLLNSKSYYCSGSYDNNNGQTIYCHNRDGHGQQNIVQGFENSCNPFFAQLVEDSDFNIEAAISALKEMGYSVNDSEPYVLEVNNIEVDTASTTLTDKHEFSTQWGFIGQGETMISPCMLMMWQSAIVNGTGKAVKPYLIDHTTRLNGTVDNKAQTIYTKQLFSGDTAAYVKDIMIQNGQRYTGSIPGFTLGIKSGTAQVKNGDEENAFLVGFDSNADHPIAFCVLIENRQSGDITTDSIVNTILSSL